MSRKYLLALLLGILIVAAPFARADEEEYGDEGDDDDEEAAAAGDSDGDVLTLTTANFDETIKKHKYVLAEFYAPWCGHCKTLAPHYAKASTILKSHDADVVLAKIDATQESELAQKFGVQGYPTLKWFVDGEPTEYNGPRETDGIVAWVKKKSGPATTVVEDVAKLSAIEAEHPAVVVAYLKDLTGSDAEAFKTLGAKTDDVAFVETTSKEVAAAAGLKHHGVAIIKNFKGEPRATVPFSGHITGDDLPAFIKGEKIPLTLEFNQENSDKIFNSGIDKQVILWAGAADLEADSPVFQAFKKAASQFKGKLVFVTVNNEGESHEPVTNFFGLASHAPGPAVVGFFMEQSKKYMLKEAYGEDSVAAFAQAVIDGTAPVEYKSAPIPEDNKDADVTVVVGKTVDSIVFDATKDVLIEVYAPWCGHCKALDPIYKKLAKRFRKVDSIVIAKMDGTENEHPQLEAKGYPTILFVPAEEGATPIPYDGERTLKGFTKFLKENAKVPYTLPKKAEKGDAKDEEAEGTTESPRDEL